MAESFNPQQASSLAQLLEGLPQSMTPRQLAGMDATVQLRSTGDVTDEWTVVVKNGECTVSKGPAQTPDLAIEASASVWSSLMKKTLDPAWAYMSGQIRVSGDLGLAMRLQSLLTF